MNAPTHLAGAILAGVALGAPPEAMVPLAIGALLPDIDSPKSTIGKYVPFISHALSHRTITHSLLAVFLAFAFNFWLGVGYLSHIALDMLTKAKVPLFFPISKRVGIGLVRTGKLGETITFIAMLVAILQLRGVNFL